MSRNNSSKFDFEALVDVAVVMDLIRDKNYDVSTLKLIIEKKLYPSDVDKGQNRLSLTFMQIFYDNFLNPDEMNRSTENGVVVGFIDPRRVETTMVLKKRITYVLIENWPNEKWHIIAKKNGLELDHIVQVWFFRDNNQCPWFVLVPQAK